MSVYAIKWSFPFRSTRNRCDHVNNLRNGCWRINVFITALSPRQLIKFDNSTSKCSLDMLKVT